MNFRRRLRVRHRQNKCSVCKEKASRFIDVGPTRSWYCATHYKETEENGNPEEPTDWSRVAKTPEIEKAVFAAEDEENMTGNYDFGFSGDLDFENPEIPVLTMQLPMRVLQALIAGPSSRQLLIQRHEMVGLLRIIEANPKTSESDLVIVRDLLKRA